MRATCATCGLPITGTLVHLTELTTLTVADQTPLVPPGHYVLALELAGKYERSDMPQDTVLLNRRDTPTLVEAGNREGCCGPDGLGGPNLACELGHLVAVEIADCWTPQVVLLPSGLATIEQAPAG